MENILKNSLGWILKGPKSNQLRALFETFPNTNNNHNDINIK